MRTRMRLALASSIAACALALTIHAAVASRLEFSNQGWRSVFERFVIHYEVIEIRCPLTLEGSIHSRVIAKNVGSLIGYVTRAIFQTPCEGTTVTALTTTLPWHETWSSFSGTLPRITVITVGLSGFQYLVSLFQMSCLYGATPSNPATSRLAVEAGGKIASATRSIARATSVTGGTCPTNVWWESGLGTFTVLGTTTPITVHLVA